jgi:tripartite-type tricarboxylate transporter receptor subunit TctC
MMRRATAILVTFAALVFHFIDQAIAQQQAYPNRPIRLIVPFAPGGGTDIMARMLAQRLATAFRVSVVVDNRPGGGGIVGAETTVRAAPDGYTLIFEAASYTTRAALYDLTFDPIKDITPVTLAFTSGHIICLHPSVPAKSVKELIAYTLDNPGKVNYGSSGVGGFTHLATELYLMMSKTRMNHVPYKGTGPALNDLLGGQIQVVWGSLASAVPHIKANRLRGLAVTTPKRWGDMPDLPAVAETVPNYDASVWYGVWGPKRLPQDIATRWHKETAAIVQSPETRQLMLSEGVEPFSKGTEEFRQIILTDIAKWKKVVRETHLKKAPL